MIQNPTGFWDEFNYGNTPKYTAGISGNVFISKRDIKILKELAKKVRELANREIEKEKRAKWILHNDLKYQTPLIFCDPENGWNEIITEKKLKCEGFLSKRWEMVLQKEIYWGEKILDDKVVEPYFDIGYTSNESGWGFEIKSWTGGSGGSYIWDAPIKEVGDIEKLCFPRIEVDFKTTNQTLTLANEIFDDLLIVRLRSVWWWSVGLTLTYAFLRGLEQMMFDMIDNPKFVHKLMHFISEGILKKLDYIEKNKLLSLNLDSYVGSGGFGYTSELPKKGFDNNWIRLKDMWGFGESQETLNISPAMYKEFVFQYQLPILKRFGLNCYGCCEPLEKKWQIIKLFPNLRRISVSPWANLKKMSEELGNQYVYSCKPIPTDLASASIDKEKIRKKIRELLNITEGCILEIIMKDNHTLGKNPNNLIDWVNIVRDEIQQKYY